MRLPRRRARTGSGAAPRRGRARHDRAILRLSRGGSDAVVLREFDLASKAFVTRRLRPAGSQGRRELARPRHAAAAAAPGAATSRRPAMPGRCGCGGAAPTPHEAPVLFEVPRESMSAGAAVDRTERGQAVWFYEHVGFFDVNVWLAMPPATTGRSSTCRPTSRSMRIAAGSRSSRARPGRSAARPIRATRCWESGSKTFLAGDRDFAVLFEPGRAARRCKASPGARDRLVLSILDNLRAGIRGPDSPTEGWTRQGRSPACRQSAWSTSGRSMSKARRATAICWRACRIR